MTLSVSFAAESAASDGALARGFATDLADAGLVDVGFAEADFAEADFAGVLPAAAFLLAAVFDFAFAREAETFPVT
jgi:hypothetical protein